MNNLQLQVALNFSSSKDLILWNKIDGKFYIKYIGSFCIKKIQSTSFIRWIAALFSEKKIDSYECENSLTASQLRKTEWKHTIQWQICNYSWIKLEVQPSTDTGHYKTLIAQLALDFSSKDDASCYYTKTCCSKFCEQIKHPVHIISKMLYFE